MQHRSFSGNLTECMTLNQFTEHNWQLSVTTDASCAVKIENVLSQMFLFAPHSFQ